MASDEDSNENLVTVEQEDATDNNKAPFMLYTTANDSHLPFMDGDPSDDVTAFLEPFRGSYLGGKFHDLLLQCLEGRPGIQQPLSIVYLVLGHAPAKLQVREAAWTIRILNLLNGVRPAMEYFRQ